MGERARGAGRAGTRRRAEEGRGARCGGEGPERAGKWEKLSILMTRRGRKGVTGIAAATCVYESAAAYVCIILYVHEKVCARVLARVGTSRRVCVCARALASSCI